MTTTTSRIRRPAGGSNRTTAASRTTATPPVPHLSVAERIARGKAARAEVQRASHAVFEPSPTRADPVELLERQAKSRVPELVPIRYGRMLVSPFTFYRGAAMIMAHDLAATPRSGLTVQCCGDAHLSNFGVFASPERRLVFDVNDFDETLQTLWNVFGSTIRSSTPNTTTATAEKAPIKYAASRGRKPFRSMRRSIDRWGREIGGCFSIPVRFGSAVLVPSRCTVTRAVSRSEARLEGRFFSHPFGMMATAAARGRLMDASRSGNRSVVDRLVARDAGRSSAARGRCGPSRGVREGHV